MWHLALLALLPLGPRLNVRFPERTPFAQADEFPMEWERVYSTALQPDGADEDSPEAAATFDGFWAWFFENACPLPLKLAVEAKPFELLVCARKCRKKYVPVLQFERNGTRTRGCKRVKGAR